MMTVHEVSEIAGVSIRTLQYYDRIGLLHPSARTEAGYRLYDDGDLSLLQQILLFRELEFPLKEIRRIMASPGYDRKRALAQQVKLLEMKQERIAKLIDLAKNAMEREAETMSFDAFDTSKMDEYAKQAKESWGATPQWKEYELKSGGRTAKEEKVMGEELMALFKPFADMAKRGADPASDEAVAQARLIQQFISAHYYRCTDEIFVQLGHAYGSGGDFTKNIDEAAGSGAAAFAEKAIEACVAKKQ